MFKLLCLISMMVPLAAAAQGKPEKTVVLVHGAFADGSSWDKVIPLLQAKGLQVVAVQNPLTSLADDVARQDGRSTHRAGRSSWWDIPGVAP